MPSGVLRILRIFAAAKNTVGQTKNSSVAPDEAKSQVAESLPELN
jgi:hypothetical protein